MLASVPTFWLGLMAHPLFAVADPDLSAVVGAFDRRRRVEPSGARRRRALARRASRLGARPGLRGRRRPLRARGPPQALGEGFVRAARARGASRARVLFAHALPAAAGPVITLAGLQLPVLVSGALVVEVVFGWPGMGRVTYDAVMAQDLPVVLASVLLATILVIAGSLLADLGLALVDPRLRLGRAASR